MSDINITIRLASKAATQGLDQFGRAAENSGKKLSIFEKAIRQGQRSFDSFIGNLGANLAFRAFNSIITGIGSTITNLKQFETALVGVGKTTGLQGRELNALGQQIQNLSRDIPVASTELLGLAQTAAQLGVKGNANLVKFTDTMARLAVATDIVGEQGAIAFARIINVTGESVGNIDRLGSSIVALGNNFAATESQILAVSNEVAKGGARFGLTAEQVLGLSTAMAALGVESQVAGSTTQKVFATVEKAIGKGGTELKKFTDVLGLTDDEFIKLFKTAPDQFFLKLVEGMGASAKGGKELSTVLAELGFNDLRVTKTLGPLISRTDLLTRALTTSSNAYRVNSALTEESEAAFATLESSLTKLNNNWVALTNTLLNSVAPAFTVIVDTLSSVLKIITDYPKTLKVVGIAAAAFATILTAAFVVITTQTFIASAAFATLATTAAAAWASILGPVTLVVGALALVTAAVVVLTDTTNKERLAVLQASRERRIQSGLSVEAIDKEILALENKIRLERLNKSIAEGAAVGASTVLKDQIADNSKLNLELAKRVGFEINLRKLTGLSKAGEDSVLDSQAALDARKAFAEAKAEVDLQDQRAELERLNAFGEQKNQLRLAQLEAEFLKDGEISDAEELKLQEEADRLATSLEIQQEKLTREIGLIDEANKLKLKAQTEQIKRENELEKTRTDNEEKENKRKLKQRDDFLSTAASLQQSSNKTFAAIGKAAALTQIAINAPESISNAYKFGTRVGGPVTGAIFGGIAAAAQAAQAARVAGLSFQDGGIVPGNSFKGDNVVANVNSGEMILNQQQQAQLFNQANGGAGGGQVIEVTSIVQIDETEIGRAVSRQVADGLQLGEGGV